MKLGLFFGAGAEIGYNLPSGGEFAIDIFKEEPKNYKSELRKDLENINKQSIYANNWLPEGYDKKAIYAFGKNEFGSIIESSIEYRRDLIIKQLSNFDELCKQAQNKLEITDDLLFNKFKEAQSFEFGTSLYGQSIQINDIIARDVTLFGSEFYSAILDTIKNQKEIDDLKRYAIAFLQLLVGAHGHDLVKKLNEELFLNTPDDLPIFDDVFGMFKLEFNRVGTTALELLLNENRCFEINDDSDIICILSAICQEVLKRIFVQVLDYQKLIDENFRYLFSPRTEWAKFTRMVIFLKIAHNYIKQQVPDDLPSDGYYHDLTEIENTIFEVSAIGTANYNNLIEKAGLSTDYEVVHLNGSVKDFYNPYKNSIEQCDEKPNHFEQIHVPFILTQSGIKPLTSVEMSRRYVELFDQFKDSEAIIIIGFSFNQDDSHINGLFRNLVEEHDKKIFVVDIDSEVDIKKNTQKKLRLDTNKENIIPVQVGVEDRKHEGKSWIKYIEEKLTSKS